MSNITVFEMKGWIIPHIYDSWSFDWSVQANQSNHLEVLAFQELGTERQGQRICGRLYGNSGSGGSKEVERDESEPL